MVLMHIDQPRQNDGAPGIDYDIETGFIGRGAEKLVLAINSPSMATNPSG